MVELAGFEVFVVVCLCVVICLFVVLILCLYLVDLV